MFWWVMAWISLMLRHLRVDDQVRHGARQVLPHVPGQLEPQHSRRDAEAAELVAVRVLAPLDRVLVDAHVEERHAAAGLRVEAGGQLLQKAPDLLPVPD